MATLDFGESVWRRAWKDSERFRRESPWWFWVGEILGAGGIGVLGSALGTFWTPEYAGRVLAVALPAFGGFIGLVAGALFFFVIIYAKDLFLAPYRQRDEVRLALRAIPGATLQGPKQAPVELRIDHQQHTFGYSGEGKFPRRKDGRRMPLLRASFGLRASDDLIMEGISLDILGTCIPSITWDSVKIGPASSTIPATATVHFALPQTIAPGEHQARILAYDGTTWWASSSFTIMIPKSSTPDREVLQT